MKKSGSNCTAVWRILLPALFSFWVSVVVAQTSVQSLSFARAQIEAGNYSMAGKALSRLVFFDNGIEHPETFELLAETYFRQNDFSNAWHFYDLAAIRSDNDSMRAEFTSRKAACRLYKKEYHEAMIDLMSYQGNPSAAQEWQFDLLAGIASFYLYDYKNAEAYLLRCADSSSTQAVIESFRTIKQTEKRYNPRKARVMSFIIPGSGQLYAGDTKNGLNSFMLVTGFVAVGFGLATSIQFVDAAIIVFPWFQRYYMGGYQKAYTITLDKQNAVKSEELLMLINKLSDTAGQ